MKVYKISPVLKYSPFFSLTYVSKFSFEVGDIVQIDFNKRKIEGVVLECLQLKDAKVEIRKANFQTKKIESEKKSGSIDKIFFKILEKFSKENLVTVGELIFFLEWDKQGTKIEANKKIIYFPDDLSFKVSKKSEDELILKGKDIFKYILSSEIETLEIKSFNFDKYLNFQAPHISKLDLLFEILKEKKVKNLILQTPFLGVVEKNWIDENVEKGKLFGKINVELKEEYSPAKKFLVKTGRDKNGEEEILADEALAKINKAKEEKIFLFVLSHGFSDRIFCNDCKKGYACEKCEHPYSILNDENGRFLFCKNCKNKKTLLPDQYLICKHCGSWKMFPFGIGGQRVKEFLEKEGVKNISHIDESQKKISVKKIKEEIERFFTSSEQKILIGSVRTLKVLESFLKDKSIDKTFVISTGPLSKGRNFDSDEKFAQLISQIENFSKEAYLNKREGDEISLENYKNKNKFIEEEIDFRKKNMLPPSTKVLSLITHYRYKKYVEKFLPDGEIVKGQKRVFYWFLGKDGAGENFQKYWELRVCGDLVVANSIIEQSILGKK